LIQLLGPEIIVSFNPIVIPITTFASNLIILRKAVGAEGLSISAHEPLSTIRFGNNRNESSTLGSATDGFEGYLATVLGGRVADSSSTFVDSSSADSAGVLEQIDGEESVGASTVSMNRSIGVSELHGPSFI